MFRVVKKVGSIWTAVLGLLLQDVSCLAGSFLPLSESNSVLNLFLVFK